MNANPEIKELSDRLGLEYESQDWGIINADPARLVEFIEDYEQGHQTEAQLSAMEERYSSRPGMTRRYTPRGQG